MDPVLIQLIQYMIAFGGLLITFFVFLNFMTKGYLWNYLRVKASRGKKILTKIHSVTDIYYRPGHWEEDFYIFKTRSKETLRIPVKDIAFKKFINSEMGVYCVSVAESGNLFIDNQMTPTKFVNIDPGRIESLFLRIKNRPRPKDKQEVLILILSIITAIAVVIILIKINQIEPIVKNLAKLTGNV